MAEGDFKSRSGVYGEDFPGDPTCKVVVPWYRHRHDGTEGVYVSSAIKLHHGAPLPAAQLDDNDHRILLNAEETVRNELKRAGHIILEEHHSGDLP